MNSTIKGLNEHFLSKRKEKWVKIWESRFPKWIDQIEEIDLNTQLIRRTK